MLWSSSWIIVKKGLAGIPALTFAGLRYTIAAVCLLPFALRRGQAKILLQMKRGTWILLIVLGVLYYAVTQGGQFLSLTYLPAITTSLIFSFSTICIIGFG